MNFIVYLIQIDLIKSQEAIMKRSLLASFALILLVSVSQSEIPRVINYQGMLLGSDEQPVPEGHYRITFSIYNEPGNMLWSETHDNVFITGGIFQVMLGTVNPLGIPFDQPYFFGIQVGNDPELSPRMLLTSAAYAIRAEDADKLLGFSLSTEPEPGKLLPLNPNGKFPASVLPAAVGGNYLKKGEPDTSSGTSNDPMLLISNWGNGDGINGRSVTGRGIEGRSDNHNGIVGWTGASDKSGVFGHSANGLGVTGRSDNNDGTVGWTGASDKSGVFGHSTNGAGVTGSSVNNSGVVARSDNSHGLSIPYAKVNGIDIVKADKNGVKVYQSNESAVYVETAGHDGVRVTNANWSGVYVQNAGYDAIRVQGAGQDGLRIFDNIGRYYIWMGSDTNPRFLFSKGGAAFADSGWFGPSDFAELIETDGSVSSFESGDVLVISSDKNRSVTLSSEPYSTAIIGVYSTKPGFVGTTHPMQGRSENEIPVAITGIVPCKVSTENGAIKRGDLLTTSSTPGYAMKANDPKIGTVLGKALETLETGKGKIEALIILQ
jgi:hypothetical protein